MKGWKGGRGKKPFQFPARYAGTCSCCGSPFTAGTQVQYNMGNKLEIVLCPKATKEEG